MTSGDPDAVYQLRRNYVRQNMSGECFTLMANMGDGGHNVPVIKDKWGIRKLTPRECARFQGYDDEFVLPSHLSRAQLGKQIGNSVTVPLVELLADQCIQAVSGLKVARTKRLVRRPPPDFPCQPFSAAGERRCSPTSGVGVLGHDPAARRVRSAYPKVLLLENVQYYRNHDGGRTGA